MYFKAVCALEIIMTLKYIVIMKKIILSFLLCMGVGFTMMGSPARVGDDDSPANVKGESAALTVTTLDEKPVVPVKPCNGLIKHPWKVKKINVTKLKAPKAKIVHRLHDLLLCNNSNLRFITISSMLNYPVIQGIPKRPDPRKGGGTGTQSSGTGFDFTTRTE